MGFCPLPPIFSLTDWMVDACATPGKVFKLLLVLQPASAAVNMLRRRGLGRAKERRLAYRVEGGINVEDPGGSLLEFARSRLQTCPCGYYLTTVSP